MKKRGVPSVEATNRTAELIDVPWPKGNAFVAVSEIESTTSISSGLPQMADLLAMQPNLTIPLYLVAPDDRRTMGLTEVNRPTFSGLAPLKQPCRYLAFTSQPSDPDCRAAAPTKPALRSESFVNWLVGELRKWRGRDQLLEDNKKGD